VNLYNFFPSNDLKNYTYLSVSWMTSYSAKALSHLRGESQESKLVKLKDKALVNGRSGEKKSVKR
jgi:hypothetical protein